MLLRTVVDPLSGQIADTRRRFMGSKPVQLFKIRLNDQVFFVVVVVLLL